MPGIIPSIDFSEPIFLMAAICCRKSSKVKSSSARNLRCHLLGLVRSNAFSACSMSVSTSPMSRMREAIRSGWKTSKSVELLAVGGEHDRPAGDRGDRQGGATAGVAVELGEHDAGEVRRRRGTPGRCSTASWPIIASMTKRISSGWIASRMSAACCMRFGVDAETAGGVDDDDVVLAGPGLLDALAGDGDRVAEGAGALARVEDRVVAARCRARGRTPARRRARPPPAAG